VRESRSLFTGLGVALRELRLERRVSQEQLSIKTDVHRNYIGGIERGERSPTVATIIVLARALHVPVSELFKLAEDIAEAS
jgi:transcriptional regulator with XRE-family HTH domain